MSCCNHSPHLNAPRSLKNIYLPYLSYSWKLVSTQSPGKFIRWIIVRYWFITQYYLFTVECYWFIVQYYYKSTCYDSLVITCVAVGLQNRLIMQKRKIKISSDTNLSWRFIVCSLKMLRQTDNRKPSPTSYHPLSISTLTFLIIFFHQKLILPAAFKISNVVISVMWEWDSYVYIRSAKLGWVKPARFTRQTR